VTSSRGVAFRLGPAHCIALGSPYRIATGAPIDPVAPAIGAGLKTYMKV